MIIIDENGVNPARAGMIPTISSPRRPSRSKPRASGDDPVADDFVNVVAE